MCNQQTLLKEISTKRKQYIEFTVSFREFIQLNLIHKYLSGYCVLGNSLDSGEIASLTFLVNGSAVLPNLLKSPLDCLSLFSHPVRQILCVPFSKPN